MSGSLRITIIGANYAPEPTGIAPYTTGMAEGLAAAGHEVTVVTSYPHYPAWNQPEGVPRRSTEMRNGVRVERLRHYVPEEPSAAKRLLYEIGVGARISPKRLNNPDVVICISPLLFASRIAVSRARRHSSSPAIGVVVQDIYSLGLAETGVGSSRSAGFVQKVESRLFRHVDGVSVIHERFKNRLVDTLDVPAEKVSVIRNWTHVPPAEVFDVKEFRSAFGWTADDIVVLHAGAMGVKQGLGNVVAAARVVDERRLPVKFVLLGDGGERRALEAAAAGVKSIQFMRPLPDVAFRQALQAADVLLVNEREGVTDMSVPSKLTTYFAAGRPVLAAAGKGGATAEEIRRSAAGVRVEPGEPSALVAKILELRGDERRSTLLGLRGEQYANSVLSQDAAVAAYDEWVRSLKANRG
ncbi:glycosyltransferase [Smaragdicoccus niigatensis]|uniref:glycosyltransferase n=1 Tax=Smaragdicoccus niigatensis TaxID=359359 RepID=UPI00037A95F9|nr:glycosyltransferase [Smaragdicoccus niigatensis]